MSEENNNNPPKPENGNPPKPTPAPEIADSKVLTELKKLQTKFATLEDKFATSEKQNQEMTEKLNLLSKVPTPGSAGKRSLLDELDDFVWGTEKKS